MKDDCNASVSILATIDGKIEVDWIQIEASPRPPFVIAALEQTKTGLQTVIQNRTDKPLKLI